MTGERNITLQVKQIHNLVLEITLPAILIAIFTEPMLGDTITVFAMAIVIITLKDIE